MTAVYVGTFTPGSPEWEAARTRRLGGSEIAAVLGLSPYESRFSLWHRKMGTVGPTEQNSEMEWGNRLEPVVADRFYEGDSRFRHGQLTGTYTHPDRPWQSASPDGLVSYGEKLDALLEVKTSPMGEGWGEPGTDQIPVYYRCQVLWYLNVFGLTRAHVAVLISGCDYREYVITLDDQAVADTQILIDAGADFIASLTDGRRPDIDAHDQTYQAIRATHPNITPGEDYELSDELALSYLRTKDDLTEAEKAHKKARAVVADTLGNANYGTWLDTRIVRRQAKDEGLPFLVSTRKDPRGRPAATIEGAAAA